MEELVLTDPIVEPEKISSKYKVSSMFFAMEKSQLPGMPEGLVTVEVKDNLEVLSTFTYTGQPAIDFIKFINTANFSTKSMHKRILEKLSKDGFLPGTVIGTPDPAPPQSDEEG